MFLSRNPPKDRIDVQAIYNKTSLREQPRMFFAATHSNDGMSELHIVAIDDSERTRGHRKPGR